ncbi:hypothetical protein ES703_125735 [subsurface metagenome]
MHTDRGNIIRDRGACLFRYLFANSHHALGQDIPEAFAVGYFIQ